MMSKKSSILIRVDCDFVKNLNKLYPNSKTIPERTRRLNDIIENILYGGKNK